MDNAATFLDLARRVKRGLLGIEREQICCGLTLQQFDTLRSVRDAPGLTTSAVAASQGIDLSTASRNLSVLEREGLMTRSRSKTDSRQVEHRLTARGRRCIDSLCCDEQAVFAALFEHIPQAERGPLLGALRVLATTLESPGAASFCSVACEIERK
jgi:DNA-binding MarR family transcriptional regulator